MRNAMQYDQVIGDLFKAISEYRRECENPVPCHIMKKTHRDNIFRFYEEIENMGKPKFNRPGGQ